MELADTHDRNFIIAPDGQMHAIDTQLRLKEGYSWEEVRRPTG